MEEDQPRDMFNIVRRPPLFIGSVARGSKKFVLIIAILVTFSVIAVFQYKNPVKRVIIYRIPADDAGRYISTENRLSLFVPYAQTVVATKEVKVNNVTSDGHRMLINGTKTLYPVTINRGYLMENPTLCSSVPNLSVLVIVHTATDHFERRDAARRTWTNETYYPNLGSVRVLFLLGRTANPAIQTQMELEFKKHGDMLQGDFIDAYRNLTHKGVMAYKWISERCRNAKFILKVDDDILVNMYKLFTEVLPGYKNKTKQIMCNHIHPGTMLIIRNKKSKWYVNKNLFAGQKFYPRYCSGFLVLFTNDVMPALYRAATMTPFFWVDDVYLYGLVPSHVPGIHYNGLKKGAHMLTGNIALKCYNNATRTCDWLIVGGARQKVVEEIWLNMGINYERTKNAVISMETQSTSTTTSATSTTTARIAHVVDKANNSVPVIHTESNSTNHKVLPGS